MEIVRHIVIDMHVRTPLVDTPFFPSKIMQFDGHNYLERAKDSLHIDAKMKDNWIDAFTVTSF